jgi:hypothetical protein
MYKRQIPFSFTTPIFVQNGLICGFSIYNNIITANELYGKRLYTSNEFIYNIYNIIYYLTNKIYSSYYNYKIEPPQQEWFNHTILYNLNSTIKLAEFYDTIAYNPNKRISKSIMSNKTTKFEKHNTNNNLTSQKNLFIMKFNNQYIYKTSSEGMYNMNDLVFNTVANPFFSIEYKNLDTKQTVDIDIPKNMCIEGNEILSSTFIKRLFAYKQMNDDFQFNLNYEIHIMDDNFNEIIIKPYQYILLNKNEYAIKHE